MHKKSNTTLHRYLVILRHIQVGLICETFPCKCYILLYDNTNTKKRM